MPQAIFVPAQLNDLAVDVSLSSVAQGDLFYVGSGGKWQNLAAGSAGQYLRSGGPGSNPSWMSLDLSAYAPLSGAAFTGPVSITDDAGIPFQIGSEGDPFLQLDLDNAHLGVKFLRLGSPWTGSYNFVLRVRDTSWWGDPIGVVDESDAPVFRVYGTGGVYSADQIIASRGVSAGLGQFQSGYAGTAGSTWYLKPALFIRPDSARLANYAAIAAYDYGQSTPYFEVTPSGMTTLAAAFSGTVSLASGSYGSPSLNFSADSDLGFYRYGANGLGFTGSTLYWLGSEGYTVFSTWDVADSSKFFQVSSVFLSGTNLYTQFAQSGGYFQFNAGASDSVGYAHVFRTTSSKTASGYRLVKIQNASTEKAYVDKDGKGWFAGQLQSAWTGSTSDDSTQAALFLKPSGAPSTYLDYLRVEPYDSSTPFLRVTKEQKLTLNNTGSLANAGSRLDVNWEDALSSSGLTGISAKVARTVTSNFFLQAAYFLALQNHETGTAAGSRIGVQASAANAGAGTSSSVLGLNATAWTQNGPVTTLTGVNAGLGSYAASGVVTNGRGVSIGGWQTASGGSFQNTYGLYIDATVDLGTVSRYAIYSLATSPSLFSGPINLTGDPTSGTHAVRSSYLQSYVSTALGSYLPLSGGTLTGALTLQPSGSVLPLRVYASPDDYSNNILEVGRSTQTYPWVRVEPYDGFLRLWNDSFVGLELFTGSGDSFAGAFYGTSSQMTVSSNTSVRLYSGVADGPTAVATTIQSAVTFSDSSARLLKILNNSTEKAYVGPTGKIWGAGQFHSAHLGSTSDDSTQAAVLIKPASAPSTYLDALRIEPYDSTTPALRINREGRLTIGPTPFLGAGTTGSWIEVSVTDNSDFATYGLVSNITKTTVPTLNYATAAAFLQNTQGGSTNVGGLRYGLLSNLIYEGTATATAGMQAVYAASIVRNGTASLARGVYAAVAATSSGTITDARGLDVVFTTNTAGVIQNSYGIYLPTSIDKGTVSRYALYSLSTSNSLLSGPLQLPDGSSGTPALAFSAETSTGFYRGGTNIIATGNALQVAGGLKVTNYADLGFSYLNQNVLLKQTVAAHLGSTSDDSTQAALLVKAPSAPSTYYQPLRVEPYNSTTPLLYVSSAGTLVLPSRTGRLIDFWDLNPGLGFGMDSGKASAVNLYTYGGDGLTLGSMGSPTSNTFTPYIRLTGNSANPSSPGKIAFSYIFSGTTWRDGAEIAAENDGDYNCRFVFRLNAGSSTVTSGSEVMRLSANGRMTLSRAPAASANYGLLNLGSGAFDGSTTGYFVGSSAGTILATNTASGFAGNLIDLQVGGPGHGRKFVVTNTGSIELYGPNNGWLIRSWDGGYEGSGVTRIVGLGDESRLAVLQGNNGIYLKVGSNTYAAWLNSASTSFQFETALKLCWGTGYAAGGSPDTNLYRGAANQLKTDDQFLTAHTGHTADTTARAALLIQPGATESTYYSALEAYAYGGTDPYFRLTNGNVRVKNPGGRWMDYGYQTLASYEWNGTQLWGIVLNDSGSGPRLAAQAGGYVQLDKAQSNELYPRVDNTYDLGTSALAWKDLYLDGTARLANIEVAQSGTHGVTHSDGTTKSWLPYSDGSFYFRGAIRVDAGLQMNTNLTADAAGLRDIGASAAPFNALYSDRALLSDTGHTSDTNAQAQLLLKPRGAKETYFEYWRAEDSDGTFRARLETNGVLRAQGFYLGNSGLGTAHGFVGYSSYGILDYVGGTLFGFRAITHATGFPAQVYYSAVQLGWSAGSDPTGGMDVGVKRNAAGILQVTNGTTGYGRALANGFLTVPSSGVDAATLATNAASGSTLRISTAADRTLGIPLNPTDNQVYTWEISNTDASSHTLTLTTGSAGAFLFDVDGVLTNPLTINAGKTGVLTAKYNATAQRWWVLAYLQF